MCPRGRMQATIPPEPELVAPLASLLQLLIPYIATPAPPTEPAPAVAPLKPRVSKVNLQEGGGTLLALRGKEPHLCCSAHYYMKGTQSELQCTLLHERNPIRAAVNGAANDCHHLGGFTGVYNGGLQPETLADGSCGLLHVVRLEGSGREKGRGVWQPLIPIWPCVRTEHT
eukprot:1151242-Pelagomonas_calceolata.AAC.2